MNKNEILEKAQKEGKDEMQVFIKDKSIRWTYIVMVAAAVIFSFIREHQGYPIMDLTATVSISVCAGQIYRFVKLKDKSCLLIAILMFLVTIAATVRFMMGH